MAFVKQQRLPEDLLRPARFPAKLKYMPIPGKDYKGSSRYVDYQFTFEVDITSAAQIDAMELRLLILPSPPPNPPKKSELRGLPPAAYREAIRKQAEERARVEKLLRASALTGVRRNLRTYLPQEAKESLMTLSDVIASTMQIQNIPPTGMIPEFKPHEANKSMSKNDTFIKTKTPFDKAANSISKSKNSTRDTGTNVFAKANEQLTDFKGKKKTEKDSKNTKVSKGASNDPGGYVKNTKKAFNSVLKKGVDPATITSKVRIEKVVKSPTAEAISTIVYVPPIEIPQSVMYFMKPKYVTVKCSVSIPYDLLRDYSEFYVRAALYNSDGVRATPHDVFHVQHSELVNVYLTPKRPPSLGAAYLRRGQASVTIRQIDHRADRVKVFRRLAPASDGTTDDGSGWVTVFDAPMEINDQITFKDGVIYNGQVIYRALSYGTNGKPGEEFSSKVLAPLDPEPIKNALTANASFRMTNARNFIEIKVTDIPDEDNISVVRLQRYDITYDSHRLKRQNKGKGFKYVGSPKSISVAGRNEVTFIDTTTHMGRVYEYIPVGISATAGTIYGASYVIDVPFQVRPPLVAMQVTSPRNISSSPFDIEMELAGEFSEFGFTKIKDVLASKGQDQLFADQFSKNREEFSKMISFVVDREDHKTGLIETFGIVEPGVFKDDIKTRENLGVSEPKKGVKYSYSVTAVVNTSEYLFPQVVKQKVDKNTLTFVQKSISKLSTPITKLEGVIPSTAKQYDFNAKDKIFPNDPRLAGKTSVQIKKPYTFMLPDNTVKEIRVSEHEDFNRISWVYDGDLTNIDHFRISLKAGGGSIIIDTVHCDPATKTFFYRHYDVGYSVDYNYEIMPVSIAYKDIQPMDSKTILAALRLPSGEIIKATERTMYDQQYDNQPTFRFPKDIDIRIV